MRPEDKVRILHMLEAEKSAVDFVAGRDRAALDQDRMLLFALVRAIEIIDEAATKVSVETRENTPAVPWSRIVGMRNPLMHAYFDVDPDIPWRTATEEVPSLIASLKPLIGDP